LGNIDPAGYAATWHTELVIRSGTVIMADSWQGWVNSGLMAFFFLVAGLEARREFDLGELRERRRVALPLVVAVGGMVVPIAIYLAINVGRSSASGWGAAMSTDTAFTLGALALVAPGVPDRVRTYLLTFALADDVAGIVVIALAYSGHLNLAALAAGLAILGVVIVVRQRGVRNGAVYLALGVAAWVAFFQSGGAGLLADTAEAEHVEAVAVGLEAFGVGELCDGAGDLLFETGGEGDVGDFAAVDAQQVVVVLGEVFGELEAGVFVAGGDLPDEPGGLEVGQVPVGGAAGQAGEVLGDVFDAHGVAGGDEQLDDGPPPAGVALVDPAQAVLGHAVHVVGHLLGRHGAPLAAGRARPCGLLMLVVVVAVGGVAVPVVGVVEMVAVGQGLVPAAWPVNMVVAGVGQVGQRVLVVVALVRGVGVAFVDIVGVALALHAGMPAAGAVVMYVSGVNLMLGRCHGSSLLCWTASATMWATCWSARE
jgi:hypothetical protein